MSCDVMGPLLSASGAPGDDGWTKDETRFIASHFTCVRDELALLWAHARHVGY